MIPVNHHFLQASVANYMAHKTKQSSITNFATISRLTPSSGSTGTTVKITAGSGTTFANNSTVKIQGVSASGVKIENNVITFTVPELSTSNTKAKVIVTTNGKNTNSLNFNYTKPIYTITNISPTSGTSGTSVTITGKNFATGSIVKFGTTNASNIKIINTKSITCKVPVLKSPGNVDVRVIKGTNTSNAVNFNYTVPPPPPKPTIASITQTANTKNVTIEGNNFASGSTSVNFGGAIITTFSSSSTTSITFTVPDSVASGNVSVTVTSNGQTSDAISFNYTLPAPVISSISQSSGTTGTSITIIGTNFASGAIVNFGSTPATNVSVVSSTSITCQVPFLFLSASGNVNVKVICEDKSSNTVNFNYTLSAPVISSISPTRGASGTIVTITGSNFSSGAIVRFDTDPPANTSVVSGTSITCQVPSFSAPKNYSVKVICEEKSSNTVNFYYTLPPPVISSISLSSGTTGTSVTITGSNFVSGAIVNFGSTLATNVSVVSRTSITCKVPSLSASGNVNLTVTCDDQTSNAIGFNYTVPAPVISGISPSSSTSGTIVTITGSNFASGAIVNFGSTLATKVSVVSSTSITCEVPFLSASANVNVTVTCNGQTSNAIGFIYSLSVSTPTITSISISSGTSGSTVTIIGTNFATGASVRFGSISASNVSISGTTSITCQIPILYDSGNVNVTVTSNGETSNTYPIPAPEISSIEPYFAYAGTSVTIIGTNFGSNAIVNFDSTPGNNVSVINSNAITCNVPDLGLNYIRMNVTVLTNGIMSNSTIFIYDYNIDA